jgi:hypothetical protein
LENFISSLASNYLKKLIAYQPEIINLHHIHDYVLEQVSTMDETPVVFDIATYTAVYVKGSKLLLLKQQDMTGVITVMP